MRSALFLLLFSCTFLQAQSSLGDPELTSYTWYLGGQWDSLYNNRKTLVEESGQDYFFLRYRLSAAAFYKEKYRIAIDECYEALRFNSTDTFTLKLLEVSLLESGRNHEALLAAKRLRKLGAAPLPRYFPASLNSVSADMGIKISNSTSIDNLNYKGIGVGIYPIAPLLIHASFSSIQQSNYYSAVVQKTFTGFTRYQFRKGLSAYGHFSYLNVAIDFKDKTQRTLMNNVGGLGIKKSIGNWDVEVGYDMGNLNDSNQTQESVGLTWFPLSNPNLTLRSAIICQQQSSTTHYSYKAGIAGKILPHLWLSADYYKGSSRNIVENNGFFINNAYDIVQSRSTAALTWIPGRKFSAYISASYELRTETFEQFDYNLSGIFSGIRLSPW
jgi:hypothetical protein